MKSYGFIYDKKGNVKTISAPFTVRERKMNVGIIQDHFISELIMKPAKNHTKTVSGKIPDNVGYPGFPSNAKRKVN